MKKALLTSFTFIFSSLALANGEGLTIREQAKGTSEIDEEYLDELVDEDRKQLQESRKNQLEKTREKMEDNPRNPAFSESFENVSGREDKESFEKE
ncbi:MAG: hypothetical protein ACLGHN_02365 [Bacteriovoracia bacterium]